MFKTDDTDGPILWVGDARDAEFAALSAWATTDLGAQYHPDCAAAAQAVAAENVAAKGVVPRAIVLLEKRPGAFSTAAFAALRAAAPLSAWAVVYGVLCAGDTRTGRPIAGVRRIAVAVAQSRLTAWLADAHIAPNVAWTDEDRLLDELPHVCRANKAARISIGGVSQLAPAVAEACRALGYRVSDSPFQGDAPPPAVQIWIGPAGARAERAVAAMRQQQPSVPIVALVSFPLPEDLEALHAAGAASILPLPLEIADLARELARLAQ